MGNFEGISWPGWDVVEPIGKGAFGSVYKIRREVADDEEFAALKVISIPKDDTEVEYMLVEGQDKESITQSFRDQMKDIVREYKIMKQMRDVPNIVHCDDVRYVQHDSGYGWDIYIQMELLTPLMKCLDKVASEEEIIRLTEDMCAALEACQSQNIIHRDIKPQNVFVSNTGKYKLGDFGIARSAEHSTNMSLAGTYPFMAPEVATGKYDRTVDIYSLGLLVYWLLNEGRGPFVPEKPTHSQKKDAQDRRFAGEPLPAPKYGSEGLKRIVLKACAYDPKARYQSARQMMEALQALRSGVKEAPQEDTIRTAEERETVWVPEQEENVTPDKQRKRSSGGEKTVRNKPQAEKKKARGQKKDAPRRNTTGVSVIIAIVVILVLLAILAQIGYKGYVHFSSVVAETELDPSICVFWNRITKQADGHPLDANGICQQCGINAFSVNAKGMLSCVYEDVEMKGDMVIPAEIDGRKVREIAEGTFANMTKITSIVIPDSVAGIANHAFDGCSSLEKVSLPQNLVAIGADAFAGCNALQSVQVPDSVICIGANAFSNCKVSIGYRACVIGDVPDGCEYTVRAETAEEIIFWTEEDAAEIVEETEEGWNRVEKWYNEQGALIKTTQYGKDGSLFGWGWNAYEQIISDDVYRMRPSCDKTEYFYNADGELAALRVFYGDGTVYEYTYLAGGNAVKLVLTGENGKNPGTAYYNDIFYLGINLFVGSDGKALSYDYY